MKCDIVLMIRFGRFIVWVCVAALAILGRLDWVDKDLTGSWLSERQLPNGGLNGRPEKLEDVSYFSASFPPARRRALNVAASIWNKH